jgi:hypothetical protein
VESPGAYLHARRASGAEVLRFGATGAAAALLLSATGDVFLVMVLLGLAALDVTALAVSGAALTAAVVRWGSTSLAGIVGGQAVLGPALLVGPWPAAVSAGAAAVALLCVGQPGPTAAPFGLAAALVVAGPATTSSGRLAVHLGAAVLGVLAALVIARQVGAEPRRRIAYAAAVVAIAAALA